MKKNKYKYFLASWLEKCLPSRALALYLTCQWIISKKRSVINHELTENQSPNGFEHKTLTLSFVKGTENFRLFGNLGLFENLGFFRKFWIFLLVMSYRLLDILAKRLLARIGDWLQKSSLFQHFIVKTQYFLRPHEFSPT